MKFYKKFKNSIQGFKDVSETVKTVEKIAASSVHFLETEVANLNEYTEEINRILARLSSFYRTKTHPLLEKKYAGKNLLIVLTGDRGLVGGLWHEIVNTFLKENKHEVLLVLGAKGKKYFQEEKLSTIDLSFNFSKTLVIFSLQKFPKLSIFIVEEDNSFIFFTISTNLLLKSAI